MQDDYLSAEDACLWAKISRRTLTNRLKSGDLAHEYRGRRLYVCRADLETLYRKRVAKQPSKDFQSNKVEEILSLILAELKEIKASNMEVARLISMFDGGNYADNAKKNSNLTPSQSQDLTRGRQELEKKLAISANEQRAEAAKQRLFAALDAMDDMPMYRGKPSITGIHKITGLDRGTISKYLNEYLNLS